MPEESDARRRFLDTIELIEGAYARNTIRAYYADMEEFILYCEEHGLCPLPAEPSSVAGFLTATISMGIKSSSIRRKRSSISSIHQMSDMADPTKSTEVELAMRRVFRSLGGRFQEAWPLSREELRRLLAATGDDLRGRRDRALLLMAFDSLRRRQELTSLVMEELRFHEDYAVIELRKSKEDLHGTGHWIHLGPEAATALREWLNAASLSEGFVLRGVTNRNEVTRGLTGGQISRIMKRIGRAAGFDPEMLERLTLNSLRIGGARELMRSGATLAQVMQKGGWEKTDTLMRYVEPVVGPAMLSEEREPFGEAEDGEARERFLETIAMMEGAFASSTIAEHRRNMEEFLAYCRHRRLSALPASPEGVAAFLFHLFASGHSPKSVERRSMSISVIHQHSGLQNPTRGAVARVAMRKIKRTPAPRRTQAYGVSRPMLEAMLKTTDKGLRGLRDRALLLLAYDTLRRRRELASLMIEDLEYREEGAVVLLQRSKTDQYGAGHWLHLTGRTAGALRAWIDAAELTGGPILRGISRGGRPSARLDPGLITGIYRRLARAAGFEESVVERISSHSMRVGGAQELLQSGTPLPEIMRRGGWVKSDTVMRYVQRTRPPGLICEDEGAFRKERKEP